MTTFGEATQHPFGIGFKPRAKSNSRLVLVLDEPPIRTHVESSKTAGRKSSNPWSTWADRTNQYQTGFRFEDARKTNTKRELARVLAFALKQQPAQGAAFAIRELWSAIGPIDQPTQTPAPAPHRLFSLARTWSKSGLSSLSRRVSQPCEPRGRARKARPSAREAEGRAAVALCRARG